MDPYQWHHWYLGSFLKLVGWIMVFMGHFWGGLVVHVIGAIIRDDDLYQHTRQIGEPGYHSPLHFVFGKYLYKYKIVKWLCAVMDNLFQKLKRNPS